MRFRNQLLVLGSLLVVAGALAGPARAQSSVRLFEDAEVASPPSARDGNGPRVLRARTARLRLAALDAAARDGLAGVTSPLLELNLFSDAALRAVFERFETDRLGHRTWVGRIAGDPLSTVTLTWRGDTVVGGIQTADLVYRVQGTMDAAVIEQVDPASFGEEREPVAVAADALETWPASPPPAAALDGEVADILVYYTTAARNAQGGTSAIEALIATAIADANTAYARSGVAATLRLAAAAELTGYVESTNMSDDLTFLRSSSGVAAARNSVGADLVALIVASSTGGACGIGYLGPSASYAHSVTSRTCIVGNYTFAHEVGHNLGSHHAPEDGATGAWKSYGYGYKDYTANFRTVMAYAPGARILNFSNPDVLHNGRVTGSAAQRNALSLREAFPIVQGFRSAVPVVAPSAPRNLAATVTGNLVSLAWQVPTTGVPIAYMLQVGTAPGAANLFAGSVGLTTAVSASLPAGVYYARVYATNLAGTGPASAEVTVNVGIGPPPGPPQGLVGSVSGSTVNVAWAPPLSGGPVASYVAQVGTSPGAANILNAAVGPITAASGSLGPDTYYIRVRAQNTAGLGAASNEIALTVGPSCTVPAAPVLTGWTSGGAITIQWTIPAGGPVSGYTVQAGTASGASNLFNAVVGLVNSVSAPVGPGPYYIRVLANSVCGTGPVSNQVSVTVP